MAGADSLINFRNFVGAEGERATVIQSREPNMIRRTADEVPQTRDLETVNDGKEKFTNNIAPSMHLEEPSPVVIPKSERRGILAWLTLLEEVDIPTKMPRKKKWTITVIISLIGAVSPFGSAITLPALTPIAEAYKTTAFISSMSVGIYMLAMALFPLWWSSGSELVGRRTVYVISNIGMAFFSAMSAISPTIGIFLAMRFFTGGASSAAMSVGAGTIADIWVPEERGTAMGYFFLGPLCGPLLAPILGGALSDKFGWASTQWFLTIYGVVMTVLVLLGLPETSPRRIVLEVSESEAEGTSTQPRRGLLQLAASGVIYSGHKFKELFIDPFKLLAYLQFPAVALSVSINSITFGALYVVNISLEHIFSNAPYSFPSWMVGFVYTPASVGYIVASLFGGRWMDKIMRKRAEKNERYDGNGKLVYLPEDRMRENAWCGVLGYPAAAIWYGWAAHYRLFWPAVLVPPFFLGVTSFLLLSITTTMLTEFMPGRSASGVAINNLCRNMLSFAGSLITIPWMNAIGVGWTMTIVAALMLSSGLGIWLIARYGEKWRVEMDKKLSR
ncbi:unnamed protein product [Clonostachys rosea]|uniref:Major facilitator superfamily (MFS) profile domain-containing protein n=1 Tax=Bionectria ochroleuca TaxID=29856 RepID=A0ABY6U029_BIOOC|nr:unnamed protein product [Clonostachys rosea]